MKKSLSFLPQINSKGFHKENPSSILGLEEMHPIDGNTDGKKYRSDLTRKAGSASNPTYTSEPRLTKDEEVKLEKGAKTFQFESDWLGIVQNLARSKSEIGEVFLKCINETEKFSKKVLKNGLLSFNCPDINQIAGSEEEDPHFLVLKFDTKGLQEGEIEKIILPVFLAMAGLLITTNKTSHLATVRNNLKKWHQEKGLDLERMLDEVIEITEDEAWQPKDVVREIFEQAENLHQNISLLKNDFGGKKPAEISDLIALIGSFICEHINESGNDKIKASHITPKNFERDLQGKWVCIKRTPSPIPQIQGETLSYSLTHPPTGQYYAKQ